jgi:hypothetical protein
MFGENPSAALSCGELAANVGNDFCLSADGRVDTG